MSRSVPRRVACKLLPVHRQCDMRWILRGPVDVLCSSLVIACGCFENIRYELLRIAVNQRKPRALNLQHDLMALEKAMVIRVDIDGVFKNFVRRNGRRMNEALPEAPTENFVSHKQLVP
jgi:hypothetical protein